MTTLKDKVTIVTGASSGIGRATALLFAESKAKLVLTARNVEKLTEVAEECESKGLTNDNILVFRCDVSKKEDMKDLVDETIKKFGRLDILVKNAGKGIVGGVMETSEEQLDDVMNTNFKSAYTLSRLCVPHLIKTQGSIVNVSSIAGQRAGPHLAGYCISKAAMDMLTKILGLELAAQKVRVNSVNPGYVITNFAEAANLEFAQTDDYLEGLKNVQPLGGAGTPEDVAKAIRFLASDEASFITGTLLFVDSGRHALIPIGNY